MPARSRVCFTLQIWSLKPARTIRSQNMQQKPAATSESFQSGEIKDVVVRDLRKFNDRRGWVVELFPHDEIAAEVFSALAYISSSKPCGVRGPHEHVDPD